MASRLTAARPSRTHSAPFPSASGRTSPSPSSIPKQIVPISYQTNLSLQHQFESDLVLEVAYIGNESRHLTAPDFSLNQVPTALMGPGDTQRLRPFPQFSNVTWINPSIGRSSYHGGFIRAQKRFSDSFSVLAHYTWSRFLDDVTAADEYGSNTGGYMDAYNRDADWAVSGSDVPHHFVATVLYEIPSVHDPPGAERGAVRLEARPAADGAVGRAVHGDDDGQHDQRVSGGFASPESRGRSGAARRRAHVGPLVRHGGVPEPGGVHVRHLAALGASRPPVHHAPT